MQRMIRLWGGLFSDAGLQGYVKAHVRAYVYPIPNAGRLI
jgi:hypothetical protein